MANKTYALFLLLLATPQLLGAQGVSTGFVNRSITVEGEVYRYQVYVPREYTRAQQWPLILFLHGAGAGGSDGLLQTQGGLGSAIRQHTDRYPAVVIFPQARPEMRFAAKMTDVVIRMLEVTEKEFAIDTNRLYLTGLSRGGNGAWYLAYRQPERFAAMLISCAWILPRRFPGATSDFDPDPVVPAADGDPFEALARRMQRLPSWVFHGDADKTVNVEESRLVAAALQKLNAPVQYTELAGVGHESCDAAYDPLEVTQWLFAQRRLLPDR